MTFSFFETSMAKGLPLNLYFFKTGTGAADYLAYTDGEREITVAGITYTPQQIARGKIASSGSLDKANLDIRMPRTNPLVELFRVYPPNYVVTLVVSQGHYGDPDNQFMAIWSGRILTFDIQVNEAAFGCEPVGTSIKRPGLRRNYQYGCPHALYGDQCRATKTAHPATVLAIDNAVITVPEGWFGGVPAAKYLSGLVEWSPPSGPGAARTILRIDGNMISIAGSTVGLFVGASINLFPGCNHQIQDCETIHNNILNFGGCPWIPIQNPVGSANQYY